jgi:nucleotide-binding universal stress UspA family protein
MNAIRSIVHPTDFSDLSAAAFAHALRIALATKSKLHLLHVSQYDATEALAFPHARRLLAQWGLSDEDDPPSMIASKLGIEVDNIRLKLQEPTRAIVDFLSEHPSDLVVLATHGRDGVSHWLQGSVAEAVSAAPPSRPCSLPRVRAVSSIRSVAMLSSGARWFRSMSRRRRGEPSKPFKNSASF